MLHNTSVTKQWILGGTIASITPPGFAPADAHDFDVPRVQNCLLEFSV